MSQTLLHHWSEDEDILLCGMQGSTDREISEQLTRLGFKRSILSVSSRKQELGLTSLTPRMGPLQKAIMRRKKAEGLTTKAIAKEMGVDQGTVRNVLKHET